MENKPNLRGEIRDLLRASWEGITVGKIMEETRETRERVESALKKLKGRHEAERDADGRWWIAGCNSTPKATVRRLHYPNPPATGDEPGVGFTPVQPLDSAAEAPMAAESAEDEPAPEIAPRQQPESRPLKDSPEAIPGTLRDLLKAMREPIEDLDARDTSRLRFVPSQELDQPAPETEAVVTLKLTVPVSVARRMLLLVP